MDSRYFVSNIDQVDSPAVLIFPGLIGQNLELASSMAGGPQRLRPHVKTHKMSEVAKMQLAYGIKKFKCATIAEAEMLAIAGAKDILLAYQPTVVKARRLAALAEAYPRIAFGYLIDNTQSATDLAGVLTAINVRPWLDLNVGMNRSGIPLTGAPGLYRFCRERFTAAPVGLHAYDGHIHDTDTYARFKKTEAIYLDIKALRNKIYEEYGDTPGIVVGGTPGFPFYAQKDDVDVSPGTFVFWDDGYTKMFPDMKFTISALLLTRIISIVNENTICLDLGYKSVAAENPLPRVTFPDHPYARVTGQSEEHLILNVPDIAVHRVGDVWYGIPYHICPTIALYDSVQVIEDGKIVDSWKVVARDRQITY